MTFSLFEGLPAPQIGKSSQYLDGHDARQRIAQSSLFFFFPLFMIQRWFRVQIDHLNDLALQYLFLSSLSKDVPVPWPAYSKHLSKLNYSLGQNFKIFLESLHWYRRRDGFTTTKQHILMICMAVNIFCLQLRLWLFLRSLLEYGFAWLWAHF